MNQVRRPSAAGSFYPANSRALRIQVERLIEQARKRIGAVNRVPRGLIVPHAGYEFSGPVAASAYVQLERCSDSYQRVLLIGPSHRYQFDGLALSTARGFETPLGIVEVDRSAIRAAARRHPTAQPLDEAHYLEHSLEVQLPFLQLLLPDAVIVPALTGQALPGDVADFLELLWDEPGTLAVVSTDLSHYHNYKTAKQLDSSTSRAIESLQPSAIGDRQACGSTALRGLLVAARRRALEVAQLDLRSINPGLSPGKCRSVK